LHVLPHLHFLGERLFLEDRERFLERFLERRLFLLGETVCLIPFFTSLNNFSNASSKAIVF
tara:strand:+ start:1901 stop:2083 length:183 start_codon:yes stop_codon:yes gene_type:complete